MKKKNPINLPPEFIILLDKIVEANPDFKNRTAVVRYAIRKYYDELEALENEKHL
jgi:Arc/MetJ-type ribon-helix-helix transcriptional regulator